jgi:hypothetical protein
MELEYHAIDWAPSRLLVQGSLRPPSHGRRQRSPTSSSGPGPWAADVMEPRFGPDSACWLNPSKSMLDMNLIDRSHHHRDRHRDVTASGIGVRLGLGSIMIPGRYVNGTRGTYSFVQVYQCHGTDGIVLSLPT